MIAVNEIYETFSYQFAGPAGNITEAASRSGVQSAWMELLES